MAGPPGLEPVANSSAATATSKMRRVKRTAAIEKTEPARFLTSRGDVITAFTAAGHELGIREGSVVDEGFEDEAVVLRRLA